MKLHHSQTGIAVLKFFLLFDHHMKLHHSQTLNDNIFANVMFDHHMKLHHSQTSPIAVTTPSSV